MSATSNVNVRVDADIKSQVNDILNSLGLDMSTAINMYLHQIIENNGIPFMIQKRYNAETELAIKEAHEGKNLVGPFDTVDALWESLNAED